MRLFFLPSTKRERKKNTNKAIHLHHNSEENEAGKVGSPWFRFSPSFPGFHLSLHSGTFSAAGGAGGRECTKQLAICLRLVFSPFPYTSLFSSLMPSLIPTALPLPVLPSLSQPPVELEIAFLSPALSTPSPIWAFFLFFAHSAIQFPRPFFPFSCTPLSLFLISPPNPFPLSFFFLVQLSLLG